MSRYALSAGVMILAAFSGGADAAGESVRAAEMDSVVMQREADAFLAGLPAGLQQRQTEAVELAIAGDRHLLDAVRNSRNSAPEYSEGVEVEEFSIRADSGREVRMRLYSPDGATGPLPLLIYLHGGGWTFGSLNSCARFCDALVATAQVRVAAVDYSLAPEHPFPAGLDDCVAAARYILSDPARFGSAPGCVSIGGDSSGGNLAIATALSLTGAGDAASGQPLASLVLFYPVVRAAADDHGTWLEYGDGYGLDAPLMEAFNRAYLADEVADEARGQVSPLEATDEVLHQLPPVLMVNAGRDILTTQGCEFVRRLEANGVEVRHHILPGSVHLFITVSGQPHAFDTSVRLTADFLGGVTRGGANR